MALKAKHNETEFGVGDKIRITHRIVEGGKERSSTFEGMVISIHGSGNGKSVTVRRIGEQNIGIERIIPLISPALEKVEVIKKGLSGVHHAKLYFTRGMSAREVEEIYARAIRKGNVATPKKRKPSKKK